MTFARSVLDTLATLTEEERGAALEAMSGVLSKTEWWSPAQLESHQLLRVTRLIEHARTTVPFYSGLPTSVAGEAVTLERFRELPLLRREDVRERARDLVSRRIPPAHRVVREANSSGSTGRHVTVRVDGVSRTMGDALSLRDNAWHGRDPTLKAAGIRAIPTGADAPLGRTEAAWTHHPKSGPLSLLDIHTAVKDQLDWLVREAPAYLATYATNAAALVECAAQDSVLLPGLREIGTFGEVVPSGLREACRHVFGVPLVDAYSCVETGFIALECPDHEHYHVQSENVMVEVLRQDGAPCAEGETGQVVLTSLHAFAMPLVRYEIGDYAEVGPPCPCGRGLPVLSRVLGRARNMIRLPSGDRVWPRFGSNELGKLFPIKQFRLVQKTLRALVLELVADRPLTADEERRLSEYVLGIVRHPFELSLRYTDTIPRSPTGKFEDVICEIGADRSALTAHSGC